MSLAIHTDAPLLPLTQMVGDAATIEVGKAVAGGPDCMEGWAEAQSGPDCRAHHVVWGADDETIYWIAKTLRVLGYDLVVTEPVDPDDQYGDHAVVQGAPEHYVATHQH